MSKKSNKIILAGIFYPDIGGPATHILKIAEALNKFGHKPVVITYGDYGGDRAFPFKVIRVSNKLPPTIRRAYFLMQVLKEAITAKALYAFNLSTAGIPVFMAGKLFHKKILIRVPGDPIWERVVENGKRFISFANYYEQGLYLKDRPQLFRYIKFILPKFNAIVFYSPFLSKIYQKYYGAPVDKITLIINPVFRRQGFNNNLPEEPTLLFAGRFVSYKNLPLLASAFNNVREKIGKGKLVIIGDGPDKESLKKLISGLPSANYIEIIPKVDQETLFKHISQSWLGIGPALTEFNPNFILECLSLGKPVLLSRENGLSVELPEEFLFDVKNQEELEAKLTKFFDKEFYNNAVEVVNKMNLNQTWEDVTRSHLKLLREVAGVNSDV